MTSMTQTSRSMTSMTEEICPRPTIEIPQSLYIEYGKEIEAHKKWKTLVIGDHIISLNHILGLGCQGVVYDADSNKYGNVVVKEIPYPIDITIHTLASSLNIGAKVYDHCYNGIKLDAKTYIVFEKLERMISLKDMRDSDIAHQVCENVTRLIEHGIFHNDIRDTNVMIDYKGNVKIIDYDYSTLAFDYLSPRPYITAKKYDKLLKRNYTIFLDEKKYEIAFPYMMQQRHRNTREKYSDMLVQNFIMGVGYD